MNCYQHDQKKAVGTCVHCGKFICEECNTEINSKNYCKKCVGDVFNEKEKQIDDLKKDSKTTNKPNVFMNAGGGASSSSSSSSSSSASSEGDTLQGCLSAIGGIVIIIIIIFVFRSCGG